MGTTSPFVGLQSSALTTVPRPPQSAVRINTRPMMAANGSGLQWSTIRSIALAWVLTLPAAMLLAGCLYYAFRSIV